nr:TetR/AcrR family transcriptional regulator [Kibdelosporangium sp. MJ126-NF4]CEL19883.1 Transcriptional regulator, TetR family [Kibdelosporangium sp. MJ126-NF4]CTQ97107.1 Transcriptional regulator, TetR family [Kibdelosporangium sp. MJ126-NF4]
MATTRPRNRKAAIALAAAELFCARGFHNVSIESVAQVVGITGPAIYRHFPTKQAMLAAALDDLSAAFVDCVHSAERLQVALAALVRFTFDRRAVTRLYQWQGRYLSRESSAMLAERYDSAVSALRGMLLDTRPELSKRDASVLVAAALSVVASPATHRTARTGAAAEQTILDCAMAVLAADLPPTEPHAERSPAGDALLELLPRRERLLSEAIRLFHQRGYHEVSIADIGAAAGINASSVYRHYASKAELLAAAYYRATSRLELATAEALAGAGTREQALSRLVDTYVRITFEQADLAAVYVSESDNLPAADLRQLRIAQRGHVNTWVDLASIVDGEVPALVRFRVHAALNAVTDLARSQGASVTEARAAELARVVVLCSRARSAQSGR